MRAWVLAFVLGAFAIAPFLYFVYYNQTVTHTVVGPRLQNTLAVVDFTVPVPQQLEEGLTVGVISCQVLDGYQYMLNLQDGSLIEAHLPVATKGEAIPFVVDAFNKTTAPIPTAKLLRNIEGIYWVVDIELTVDGQRKRLVDMLHEKDLTLD